MKEEYEIRVCSSELIQEELNELRQESWGLTKSNIDVVYGPMVEIDRKEDPIRKHLTIWYKGKIVASSRYGFHNDLNDVPYSDFFKADPTMNIALPTVSLSRVVVHPDHRRKNLSMLLLNHSLDMAKNDTANSVLGFPFSWRLNHLLKRGFTEIKALSGANAAFPLETVYVVLKAVKNSN
jgi:predicted GNAT family N-acyltransferase